jgi:asparagine synthase (glutamine-hydrolysing)
VASRYGTDHHELVLRPDAAALLPEIAAAFDEPFADSSALPTYAVSRLASEHVKVALSGEGGDELFGGYFTYVADVLAARSRVARGAALARPAVERLPSSSRRVSLEYRAKRFARAAARPPLERHHGWKEIFSAEARAALLEPERRAPGFDPLSGWRARFAETAGAEPLARLQDVDIGTYLVDDLLVKTDRASMAHSLEVRVPFLDPVVAELAFALPTSQKVLALAKKRVLRRAAAGLVPRAIVHGPKRGFSIPAAAWLRGELRPFARDVLSPDALRRDGFFRPAEVTRLLDEHESAREDHSRALWGLLCFQLWRATPAGRDAA